MDMSYRGNLVALLLAVLMLLTGSGTPREIPCTRSFCSQPESIMSVVLNTQNIYIKCCKDLHTSPNTGIGALLNIGSTVAQRCVSIGTIA